MLGHGESFVGSRRLYRTSRGIDERIHAVEEGEKYMPRESLYSIPGPKTTFEMTWEEVEEVLQETDIILVPCGSTEQHGPHLPLGNDALQATEMTKRTLLALESRGVKAVAGPTIPFGTASYHMPFPGTISLKADTFKMLLKEVCLSFYAHGFKRQALILGHGGNYSTMMTVAQELVDETDAQVLVLNWLKVMTDRYSEILTSKDHESHAGEGETSRMLALHPELVQLQRARVYRSERAEKMESHEHPLLGGGVFRPSRSFRQATPVGSVGDPRLARAETGEKLYTVIADWLATIIAREFGPKPAEVRAARG